MIGHGRHRELLPEEERGHEELGQPFGQRRDRREDEGGRAAEEDREREGLAACLGLVIVETAALPDLPVDARRFRTVDLDAVHPEIRLPPGGSADRGMLGVDQGQRQEGPAVFRPLRECGQTREVRPVLDDIRDGSRAGIRRPDAERASEERAERPELPGSGGQKLRGRASRRLDEFPRLFSERELETLRRAEEVRHDGKVRALRALEEKRGPAFPDHAAVYLRNLEPRVRLGLDDGEVVLLAERVEEGSQVSQANLSVAATRARVFGGSQALWPASGEITKSASGHARWRAQALKMGQTTS